MLSFFLISIPGFPYFNKFKYKEFFAILSSGKFDFSCIYFYTMA